MKRTNSIKEDIHFRVLHALEVNPHMTQRELASLLNVSLGRANFLIKALVEIGHIKLKNFEKNPNKTGYFYLLTPQGILEKSNLTSQFLKRKIKEYEFLKKEIESLGGKL
jgi:EPS-associated MarR family transcriptional regulator